MNLLAPALTGAEVLDLFAGSGALGLEALSRGAARATFVEQSARALACLRSNVEALGAEERATIVRADVFAYLARLSRNAFDIAVADPPYGRGMARKLAQCYMRRPFARVFSVEHGPGEELGLPPGAVERRYGDTVLALVTSADLEEDTS